jgi:hypothetical protein
MSIMPPRSNPILVKLKRKAPRIPDFTCPEIDAIIDQLTTLNLPVTKHNRLRRSLERLRKANESLRDSGEYWYEVVKSWLT